MAASAAATVKVSIVNIWPTISPENIENEIKLILLAVNINLISFSIFSGDIVGQIFTMLILTVAAAEAAIGLAIIVIYYRNKGSIRVEDIHGMKG